jgi:hypothetical protein
MAKGKSQMSNKEKAQEILLPVIPTSAELRDALFDELDRMRNGKTTAANANAIARLASNIVRNELKRSR